MIFFAIGQKVEISEKTFQRKPRLVQVRWDLGVL